MTLPEVGDLNREQAVDALEGAVTSALLGAGLAHLLPCGYCRAKPGHRCRTGSGGRAGTHLDRWVAVRELAQAAAPIVEQRLAEWSGVTLTRGVVLAD